MAPAAVEVERTVVRGGCAFRVGGRDPSNFEAVGVSPATIVASDMVFAWRGRSIAEKVDMGRG